MTAPSPKNAPEAAEPQATGTSAEADPLIGKVISDRFRILAPIARGGMGVVYKAEQAPLGRLVAIKVLALKHDEEKDPEFRKRFFLEAATVAKLTHPNTVTVFDYGQAEGGIYYIAMELVNGRTLKKALSAEGPFPPARAVNIAQQICRSLREAHRLGVVHRDMKPGNVMLVDRDGEDYVKVLDFGLVKQVRDNPDEDLTQAGVFMGSPKYMAPEQIQGEDVDARTDIYSVGVILYEMLTGRVPFQRDNTMQVLMDHLRSPVPPMTTPEGVPPIPAELQAVVLKCLEKKPENRYPDMDALLLALKSVGVDGVTISSSSMELGLSISGGTPMSGGTPISGGIPISGGTPGSAGTALSGGTPISGVHTLQGSGTTAGGIPLQSAGPSPEASVRPSRLPVVAGVLVLVAAVGTAAVLGLRSMSSEERSEGNAAQVEPASPSPGSAVAPSGDVESPPPSAPPPETMLAESSSARDFRASSGAPASAHSLLLSLRSNPPGATVRIGAREYGPTPAQVELVGELAVPGQQLELIFERPGYRTVRITRTIEGSSLDVDVRMSPVRRQTSPSGERVPETRVEGYRDSPY